MILEKWWRRWRLAGKGEDVFLGRNVHFTRPHLCYLGNHIALDDGVCCTCGLRVGDHCHISPYVTILGGKNGRVILWGFNTIGSHSILLCATDTFDGSGLISSTIPDEYRGRVIIEPIIMERFSNIGTNCTIMPGVRLREGSVIGANSFVNKSTEPWTVYVGTPAKPLKARPKGTMIEAARKMGY